MAEERTEKRKNPLEKIAEMTGETAKLVLTVQSLSKIKNKDGKEQGFAEISDEKLANILKVDKSEISGKNGLIYQAVLNNYIFAANVKTNQPVLDENGNPKLNSQGETIMKSHRVISETIKGLANGFEKYGVEVPDKIKERLTFKPKEKDGLSR